MRIDGKVLRDKLKLQIKEEIGALPKRLSLAIVVVGESSVVREFVRIKKRFAIDVGVRIIEKQFPADVSFAEIEKTLHEFAVSKEIQGIIVQLPLPRHLDVDAVLDLIPESKDVDVLSRTSLESFKKGTLPILPPVTAAIEEICRAGNIELRDRNVLMVGSGRLVGAPTAVWLRAKGAHVEVTKDLSRGVTDLTRAADIIVCGAGLAGLIKPEMIASGVVLIDAGTSESGGVMVGDVDPRCEELASLFTPVPGGVGPVTVAMIFKNLCMLAKIEDGLLAKEGQR